MQVDPQLSTVLTKAKKANIMSSFKVNASLPESQGQDLGGQGQGLRGQGQGRGLDFRGQGEAKDKLTWPRGQGRGLEDYISAFGSHSLVEHSIFALLWRLALVTFGV